MEELANIENLPHQEEVESTPEEKFIAELMAEKKEELIYRIVQLTEAKQAAELRSFKEPVTGLYNRSFFEAELGFRIARAARNQNSSLALIVFDLDGFKDVNDKFGHLVGDLAVKTIADVLTTSSRGDDLAFKWGGDEIAILMSDISPQESRKRAEEIWHKISETTVPGYEDISLTASVGVVSSEEMLDEGVPLTKENFFKAADSAAYYSKTHGKNQVNSFSDVPQGERKV